MTKSNDRMSYFVNGHASKPYKLNKVRMHLLLISGRPIMTSSEAILPILPKMLFDDKLYSPQMVVTIYNKIFAAR